jgi:hypothetical protein
LLLPSVSCPQVNILGKKKDEEKDHVLGRLSIPVKDVVRNGQLKVGVGVQGVARGQGGWGWQHTVQL